MWNNEQKEKLNLRASENMATKILTNGTMALHAMKVHLRRSKALWKIGVNLYLQVLSSMRYLY